MASDPLELEQTLAHAARVDQPGAAQAPPPSFSARYEIVGELGRGGMGRVLEARDTLFGRKVALKELLHSASADARARFVTEALVTGNLEHPGVVPVYDRGPGSDGAPSYVMRRVKGRTLAQAIAERPSLDERLALLPAIVQVAHTVGYAHSRQVVHRDIKPDNVMLGDHGEVVLLDWGIARVRGAEDPVLPAAAPVDPLASANHTAQGSLMGTPAYMAPEQARGDIARIDARTDVFALGALLYHALSGHPPYQGPTVQAVMIAAVEARCPPIRAAAPGVAEELAAVVERSMARLPDDRFASATELAHALEAFLAHGARQHSSKAAGWAAGVVVGVAALALVVGLATALFLSSGIKEQGPETLGLIGLAALSAVLGLIEWRTQAHYRLRPLLLALAAGTIAIGIGGVSSGLAAMSWRLANDPQGDWRYFVRGIYELTGVPLSTAISVTVQLVVWALLGRTAGAAPMAPRPVSTFRTGPPR